MSVREQYERARRAKYRWATRLSRVPQDLAALRRYRSAARRIERLDVSARPDEAIEPSMANRNVPRLGLRPLGSPNGAAASCGHAPRQWTTQAAG